ILRRVPGIGFTHLTSADIVRHPLVARIVEAYDADRATELDALAASEAVLQARPDRSGLPKTRSPKFSARRR
ncbi:MAG: PhoH family protein, partial [Rhodoferax sp.]|nr:PhoH family protein [Rhodoferax sp.]